MKKHLLATLIAATSLTAAAAEAPLWLRNVKISPDGKNIAFTYKGDIYSVAVNGGEARRLTTQTSYETAPIWSPDSKQIAFASDRHGNFDIYVMDANGGAAKRLTTNSAKELPEAFSPDGKSVIYSAAIQMPALSAMFPSSRMTQLYSVGVDGGTSTQILGTPAQKISFMPDGKSFVYQDVKGFENDWRKHHTSSTTRDIWLFSDGHHRNLTNRGGEDRDPVIAADGSTLYFLSERGGTFNVYKSQIDNTANAVALTSFTKHPVRFLSRSNDGTLAFTYDGEIYTLRNGGQPAKVAISIALDDNDQTERIQVRDTRGAIPSPDGKQIAFASRGNIFVSSVDHSSIKQVTNTAAAEQSIDWAADNRSIVYSSMRDGHYNLYRASIARSDDPNFSNATLINEEPLIAVDNIERTAPDYSPDGKKIAFIQDRHKLMVMDVKTKQTKQLTDGSTYPMNNGSFTYQWSPDSKWIVIEDYNNHHNPYADISIINVATGELTNLTKSGYADQQPSFALDGNAIIFLSERYGMRAHASWGSQSDVMIVFLNRDAYDKFMLSEEDYELRQEVEKQAKEKAKEKADKKSDKKGKKADKKKDSKADTDKADTEEKPSKDIKVELAGIEDRIVRLTPYSSDIADAYICSDGKTLYYLSSIENGYDLWKMDLRKKEPSIANKLGAKSPYFAVTSDGKNVFICGDKIRKLNTSNDKLTTISPSGSQVIDHAAEREAMFDQVYISEREMFYTTDLHGVDWDSMTADYRKFLPYINNNYDFAELLSELLGELNVSHTGAGYRGNESNTVVDRTASLGLLYDMTYSGNGLKVDEIIAKGPFDNAWTKLSKGCIIEKINGTELNAGSDYDEIFNNLVGKKTLVSIYNPANSLRFDEVIIPVSQGTINDLLYERWVKNRAADVDRWSNGRLGYVHIESMDDNSFRRIYSDLLGKYIDREGVVIDIRWNGGGRLHEDIEVLFSGDKYISQVVRGVETCDMPSRRWNKPSIMVQSEACYSNAHGTPWVYHYKNLGKLVGMPVPGTMTSVNWVTLQDPTLYFGIPVIGMRINDGTYLENQQLEPDIRVANTPEDIVKGEDTQLHRAVDELLREIDAK
jgi:tricorn protease